MDRDFGLGTDCPLAGTAVIGLLCRRVDGVVPLHRWGTRREGLVSKHRDRAYRGGPCRHWLKVKNPDSPPTKRAAEADWARRAAGLCLQDAAKDWEGLEKPRTFLVLGDWGCAWD